MWPVDVDDAPTVRPINRCHSLGLHAAGFFARTPQMRSDSKGSAAGIHPLPALATRSPAQAKGSALQRLQRQTYVRPVRLCACAGTTADPDTDEPRRAPPRPQEGAKPRRCARWLHDPCRPGWKKCLAQGQTRMASSEMLLSNDLCRRKCFQSPRPPSILSRKSTVRSTTAGSECLTKDRDVRSPSTISLPSANYI